MSQLTTQLTPQLTQPTRKPRLPKVLVTAFIRWYLLHDQEAKLTPKQLVEAYEADTGLKLEIGFVRNMRRMMNFHLVVEDILEDISLDCTVADETIRQRGETPNNDNMDEELHKMYRKEYVPQIKRAQRRDKKAGISIGTSN